MKKYTLEIPKLTLSIHLGCEASERLRPQPVNLHIKIEYTEQPPGCKTDKLSHTICYQKVMEVIASHCEMKEFKLIEKLASDSLDLIKNNFTGIKSIFLCVHKPHPPIPFETSGVSFSIMEVLS